MLAQRRWAVQLAAICVVGVRAPFNGSATAAGLAALTQSLTVQHLPARWQTTPWQTSSPAAHELPPPWESFHSTCSPITQQCSPITPTDVSCRPWSSIICQWAESTETVRVHGWGLQAAAAQSAYTYSIPVNKRAKGVDTQPKAQLAQLLFRHGLSSFARGLRVQPTNQPANPTQTACDATQLNTSSL